MSKKITRQELSSSINTLLDDIGSGDGDMLKSTYDTNNSGKVDAAESVTWGDVTEKPTTFPPEVHNHDADYLSTDQDSNQDITGGSVSVKSTTTTSRAKMVYNDDTKSLDFIFE